MGVQRGQAVLSKVLPSVPLGHLYLFIQSTKQIRGYLLCATAMLEMGA